MSAAITYSVMGRWPFPADMLRYDEATGASKADAEAIALLSTPERLTGDGAHEVWEIRLTSTLGRYHLERSADRWASFGWSSSMAFRPAQRPAESVDDLRRRLQQTIDELQELKEKRRALVDRIGQRLTLHKVGDVVIGSKGLPMTITRVGYREHPYPAKDKLPEVTPVYIGRFFLKDGSVGNQDKTVDDWTLGKNIRKAEPNEIPAPKAKTARA